MPVGLGAGVPSREAATGFRRFAAQIHREQNNGSRHLFCFQDEPAVIFEVLPHSTRRIDEGEKKDAYHNIPSLSLYALVEQETAAIVAYRRTDQGFVREDYEGLTAVLKLPEIEIELPLAEIYERVKFSAEQE